MRVFITGATGFIGRYVVDQIRADGHDILAFTLEKDANESNNKYIQWLYGDLGDIESLKPAIRSFDPEVVIHLAWQGIPDYSEVISTINLTNSIQLLDFIVEETRCKKIIVSGSCFEYGKKIGECKESDPVEIISFFAWAKHSFYQYLLLKCNQKKIELIWFRIFYVYGPGQRRGSLIPTLTETFKDGKQPDVLKPMNANDFIYVDDVANAFCIAAGKEVESGIYNLGSGRATPVLEVCRIVEKEVCGSNEFTEALLRQSTPQEEISFWANITKARKLLGWNPMYDLATGIERYVKSQRSSK